MPSIRRISSRIYSADFLFIPEPLPKELREKTRNSRTTPEGTPKNPIRNSKKKPTYILRKYLLFILLTISIAARANEEPLVPIERSDYSRPTGIAPYYFGPNAFPIPDMLDGRTESRLRLELAGDGYFGFQKDRTADVFILAYIPLFTDRVNLTLWMPVMEWYRMTPERQRTCRLQDSVVMSGHEAGDVYISTDIQLLKARKYAPDIVLRAAMKTASGGGFEKARQYDDPGYFFDLAIGKSFYFGRGKTSYYGRGETPNLGQGETLNLGRDETLNLGRDETFPEPLPKEAAVELRFAGSVGFLCWQTDNGRQNDAVMYGLQMLLKTEYVSLRTTWSGYVGWEKYGDRPMSIKATLAGHLHDFEPYLTYQYGINDYPFHQVRIGLAYHIDILKYRKATRTRNKEKAKQ